MPPRAPRQIAASVRAPIATSARLHAAIAWKVPFGDAPEIRSQPALKGVPLPDRLGAVGPPGAIVTKAGLVFVGGNDMALFGR